MLARPWRSGRADRLDDPVVQPAAVVLFLAVLPLVGRIVYLRIDYLAPAVMAIAITGTLIDQAGWWSIATLLVSCRCLLANFDWPRAPLLLGFIMGNWRRSTSSRPWSFMVGPPWSAGRAFCCSARSADPLALAAVTAQRARRTLQNGAGS